MATVFVAGKMVVEVEDVAVAHPMAIDSLSTLDEQQLVVFECI